MKTQIKDFVSDRYHDSKDQQNFSRRTVLKLGLSYAFLSALGLSACKRELAQDADSGQLLVVGSSAMQPLVEVSAEEYAQIKPGVFVTVQGGGSGQGLTQVYQGAVHIGNSDVFAEEKKIDPSNLIDHKICVSGVALICHKDINLDSLSMQNLADIFTGKIRNWKDLGAQDLPIVLINRASGSGTRSVFEAQVLKGQEAMASQEQDNNGTVVRMIAETPGSISYLGFAYLNDKVKTLAIDSVSPETKNVCDNSWPLWSYSHMYTSKNADETTKAFMDFMMGDIVQKEIIPQLGYISILDMKVEKDAQGTIKQLGDEA